MLKLPSRWHLHGASTNSLNNIFGPDLLEEALEDSDPTNAASGVYTVSDGIEKYQSQHERMNDHDKSE